MESKDHLAELNYMIRLMYCGGKNNLYNYINKSHKKNTRH